MSLLLQIKKDNFVYYFAHVEYKLVNFKGSFTLLSSFLTVSEEFSITEYAFFGCAISVSFTGVKIDIIKVISTFCFNNI